MKTQPRSTSFFAACVAFAAGMLASIAHSQVAIEGKIVHTMSDAKSIENGVVVITNGKIAAVGKAGEVKIPEGYKVIKGAVVTPGLIDGRGTVGVSGIFNQRQDQDQLERSAPVQPELRAIDAFNHNDPLVAWVRSLGITTIHTGHAPGELISGQTCVVKTSGKTVDEAVLVETATVAATLGPWAQRGGGQAPGTRAKMMAMLREELLKAKHALEKEEKAKESAAKKDQDAVATGGVASKDEGEKDSQSIESSKKDSPTRNLRTEILQRVLKGEVPLLITVNYAQDIASALRLAKEFEIRIILDSASEAYMFIEEIKEAKIPVMIHPTMFRMFGEMENMSMETCSKLLKAGIPVSLQSGFEGYVPKTRVVLFEAAIAAANGCTFEEALSTITTQPARILGIDNRVGSLKVGLDGDVAIFDGDPFEYTTHCIGVVIDGQVVSETVR